MNEIAIEAPLIGWSVPECPFTIEYSPRVLDDIRLAVVDAFFSLPRGGAEIGGVLLGRREQGRLLITEYAALDCEHATGPSFTLSARDEAQLSELLARAPSEFPGLRPVGWYHSHTRSEIFLSPADLEIHNRFFPEPWQVALVMKPHTFEPARAGIFFREAGGSVHASAPYQEIVIEALPMGPVGAGPGAEMPKPVGRPAAVKLERNPVFGMAAPQPEPATPKVEAPAQPPPAVQPAAESNGNSPAPAPRESGGEVSGDPPAPLFFASPAPSRVWVVVLGICGLLALAAAGYRTNRIWLPKVMAAVRPAPRAPAPPVSSGLKAFDRDGQLQITWDRNSPGVRHAVNAILEISDGAPPPQAIALDQAHLQNGFFTYGRQSERVDVKLILHQPDGQKSRDVTTFLGKLPAAKAPEEDPAVRIERDRLAVEAAKLKADLESQAARTRKLEKDLKSVKDEMRAQQQRRLANQLPEGRQ